VNKPVRYRVTRSGEYLTANFDASKGVNKPYFTSNKALAYSYDSKEEAERAAKEHHGFVEVYS
jgi:hypothetical protein